MKNLKIFFFVFLKFLIKTENSLENDIYLENTLTKIDTKKINIFYLFSEEGKIYSGEKIPFLPIFNFSKIILGNKKKMNFGINCENSKNSNCEISNTKISQFYFNQKMFFLENAKNFFRFEKKKNFEISKKKKMEIKLIIDGNSPFDKNNIIGLSPNSNFNEYFQNLFIDQNFSFLFSYKIKNFQNFKKKKNFENFQNLKKNENLIFESNFIINPYFTENQIFSKFEIDKKKNSWIFESDINLEEIINFSKKKICLSNFSENLLITNFDNEFCEKIKKKVCEKKIENFEKKCKFENVNFSKLKNLEFIIKNKKIEFLPEEYIFFDKKKNLRCRFENFENLRKNDLCKNSDEIAIGKIFYNKIFPVFKFEKKKTFLIFLKNYDFVKKMENWEFYLILGGIIFVVIILLFFVIFKLLQEKKNVNLEKSENYEKI